MEKKRLNYIDVLRVIAMIAVFVCHYTRSLESAGVGYNNKILPDFVFNIYLGNFGVAIFFVLSGASLMYMYENRDIKQYAKKRFLGIYPMYWLAYIVAFLYFFWKNQGFTPVIPKSKFLLTAIGMDGYTLWLGSNFYILGEWFLGCLIFLYLLFPLIKKGIEKRPIVTAVVILAVYAFGPFLYKGKIPVDIFFLFRVPEFAAGMYFIYYKAEAKLPAGMFSLAILVFFAVADLSKMDVLYKDTIVGISVCVFVAWICRYIKWTVFYDICRAVGKYAYAVFLTHHVIIQEMAYRFTGKIFTITENYLMFGLCVATVAAVSVLLYRANDAVIRSIRKVKK